MPMIDVYVPDGLLPADVDRALGQQLALAVLRAEGVAVPTAFHADNTAVFIHRLPPSAVQTAATAQAAAVRIQIVTPPGALSRDGQRMLVREATEIASGIGGAGNPVTQTWVILTEAAEGGWGIGGTAFGVPEFTALAARAKAATPS